MTVSFLVEPADACAFVEHHHKSGPSVKYVWCVLGFHLLAMGVILRYAVTHFHTPGQRIGGYFGYCFIYGVAVYLFLVALRRIYRWYFYRPRKHPGFFCEHSITLSEQSLVDVTPLNRSEHAWSGIHRVDDSAEHVFIYIAANVAYVIPKRAFPDQEIGRAFFQRAKELYAHAHPGQ